MCSILMIDCLALESLMTCLFRVLIRLFLRILDIFWCQIFICVLLLMLTSKPRIYKWLLNINWSCLTMRLPWRCIMIIYINLNLIIRSFYSNSGILISLETLFLLLFHSCWVKIHLFILSLSQLFHFLLGFILFIFSLFIMSLLNC